MKKTLKFLLSLTAFSMVVGSGVALANELDKNQIVQKSNAASTACDVYFKAYWSGANITEAKVHYWNGGDHWESMTEVYVDNGAKVYKYTIPAGNSEFQYQTFTSNWGSGEWHTSVNVTVENNILYTPAESWDGSNFKVTKGTAYPYTITFNGNGATSGTMSNTTAYGNVKWGLPENKFIKTGYTFMGWATSSSGSVVYADKALLPTKTNTTPLNLYAVWEETIEDGYYIEGTIGGIANNRVKLTQNSKKTTEYMVIDQELSVNDEFKFTKYVGNHHDAYWGTDLSKTGDAKNVLEANQAQATAANDFKFLIAGTYDFYLDTVADSSGKNIWAPANTYTITYDANTGSGTKPADDIKPVGTSTTAYHADTFIAPANKKFFNWNTAADGSGTSYAADAAIPSHEQDSTTTLYAIWQNTVHQDGWYVIVDFGLSGEAYYPMVETEVDERIEYRVDVPLTTADHFKVGYSKADYITQWWGGDQLDFNATGSAAKSGQIRDGNDHNIEVVRAGTYKVIYHNDYDSNRIYVPGIYLIDYKDVGGANFSGTHDAGYPVNYMTGFPVSLDQPTKTNYAFAGYYLNQAGTGDPVTQLNNDNCSADITLYAKWVHDTWTIHYDRNGAEYGDDIPDVPVNVGEGGTAATNTFINTNKTFREWNTQADGEGTSYAEGATIPSQAKNTVLTLYAIWNDIGVKARYFINKWGTGSKSLDIVAGQPYTLLPYSDSGITTNPAFHPDHYYVTYDCPDDPTKDGKAVGGDGEYDPGQTIEGDLITCSIKIQIVCSFEYYAYIFKNGTKTQETKLNAPTEGPSGEAICVLAGGYVCDSNTEFQPYDNLSKSYVTDVSVDPNSDGTWTVNPTTYRVRCGEQGLVHFNVQISIDQSGHATWLFTYGNSHQFALDFNETFEQICRYTQYGLGDIEELKSAWATYGELFNSTYLSDADRALYVLNPTPSDPAIAECVLKYDYILRKYHGQFTPEAFDDWMGLYDKVDGGIPAMSSLSFDGIFTDFTDGSSSNPTLIIVISSVVTGLALGGYFLLRRSKED